VLNPPDNEYRISNVETDSKVSMSERERCSSVSSYGLIGLSAPMPLSTTAEQNSGVAPSVHGSKSDQAAKLVFICTSAVFSVTAASEMFPLACMHSRMPAFPVSKS